MKRFLTVILMTVFMTSAQAKETVTLLYSWTAADNAANFYRMLLDEANKLQTKYNFVLDFKPGAGGTVAANQTLVNHNNTLWLNSSAGFIRPNLFPNDSHNMNDFRILLPMCASPFVVISNKYKSWQEVKKDAKLSIGMTGLGATSHLVSIQIAKNYPNMTIVPFKSTSEALVNVLNGSVDFSIGFHGDSEQYTQGGSPKMVYWLGQTGIQSIKNTELLINQGFPKELADMSPAHQIFAAKQLSNERFGEFRKILMEASRAQTVRNAKASDNCVPISQMPDERLESWFNFQAKQWRQLTAGIRIN
jgi:tripartite-type tricarboxylate transporter receptor subunit TctC